MSTLTITVSKPKRKVIDTTDYSIGNMKKELLWVQRTQAKKAFQDTMEQLKKCCTSLHLSQKCDPRLGVQNANPGTERYNLLPKQGGDNLKAIVSLLGDNVIQAEVTIKNPKVAGGFFRSVAQPDVQWKLQQLQDLGNHIARATISLCEMENNLNARCESDSDSFSVETGTLLLNEARAIKDEISFARSSILLPRKRSLLELCYFPPTRKFVPPLPQDNLLSFYISSCRLVCASYQIVPKTVNPQGLTVFMSECQLPFLDEVLESLNLAMLSLQKLISYLDMCRPPITANLS
ncbi:unnamed protein product [Caenorhabditis auriculariae]|uniref:Protein rogdi homolog n=1 Tax=Caenorhabditis auriculariae TaxID=2777116 RepID=A0A8S1GY97_9PELO|nr:unnamed protein product [Caenorhabditis auriculariae]